jgi:hypothetical protein
MVGNRHEYFISHIIVKKKQEEEKNYIKFNLDQLSFVSQSTFNC